MRKAWGWTENVSIAIRNSWRRGFAAVGYQGSIGLGGAAAVSTVVGEDDVTPGGLERLERRLHQHALRARNMRNQSVLPDWYLFGLPEWMLSNGAKPCTTNITGCCCAGHFPCERECCSEEDQCCDSECCSPGSLCVARVFDCSSSDCEEICCPKEQLCDGQCCDGTCFDPVGGSIDTGLDRTCCPAEANYCAGTGEFAGQGVCCEGATPTAACCRTASRSASPKNSAAQMPSASTWTIRPCVWKDAATSARISVSRPRSVRAVKTVVKAATTSAVLQMARYRRRAVDQLAVMSDSSAASGP